MHTLLFILSILAAAGQPEFPSIEPALARAYAGSYQLSRDRIIDIGPMDEVGGDLIFLDHATLRTGRLRVISENELIAGPTLGSDSPISIKARFLRDRKGEVAALYWNGERARKIAPRTDELVRIRRDGIVLEGVLNRPAGRGPHPAIVLAHGSGDSTRNVGFWNMFFVRQGFAVLSLDKRGAGSSTGDWKKASLEDIADDWLAGVNYLKGRPDIDVRRIGVHGSSQGGWTGPLMAAKSRDIAFLIVRAGSGMNLIDTMVHEIEWTVKEKGFSDAEASAGARAAREAFELTARGASWDEFESAMRPHLRQKWADAVWAIHYTKDGWGRPWVQRNAKYDAATSLQNIRIPVLWFLADNDHNVPSGASAPRIAAALREAGNQNATVVMLKNATHGFLHSTTGNNSEFATASRMAPGYWDEMQRWLRRNRFSPRR